MATVEKQFNYVLRLTAEELETVGFALDAVACDPDAYGDILAVECSQIWKILNV